MTILTQDPRALLEARISESVTGSSEEHTHSYSEGDKVTSKDHGHTHKIEYNGSTPSKILPGPNGHTHSL